MVDATAVAGIHGLAHEGEDIRPVLLARTDALDLAQTRPLSLWAALGLGWLSNTLNQQTDGSHAS